jgi:enediyne biosynthesis protein E4
MRRVSLFALLLALIACVGCPTEPEPEPECVFGGEPWQEGQPAFRDATADWGLEDMEVLGVRVSVTDIDGDGWPDLLTRNGGGPDDFATEGGQRRWVLRNTGQGSFEDVTEASGLYTGRLDGVSGSRPGEIVISGDVDNDGDLDVFTAATRGDILTAGETSELMLNDGDGAFSLAPDNAAFAGVLSIPVGAALLDGDLDGLLDVFVSNNTRTGDNGPLQDRFFVGTGDGGFIESTVAMNLDTEQWNSIDTLNDGEAHTNGWGATSCDLNNDGMVEIMSTSYGRAPNHLWQARPGGDLGVEYRNRSVDSGYASDHRDEWWTSYNAQCYCEDNPSAEDCDLAPTPDDYGLCQSLWAGFGGQYRWNHNSDREPWRLGGNSATTTCVDIDNDGFLDLFTGEIAHWDVGPNSDPAEVVLNLGQEDVAFDRPGNDALGIVRDEDETGWDHGDMNNAVLDFDNDGRMDVYLSTSDYPGTRGELFHQRDDDTFERLDIDDGIDHLRSAGAAAVDLDRDGDLDLVVGHSRARCGGSYPSDCYDKPYVRIFENLAEELGNRWIELRLEGTGGSNAAAIGARVTVGRCTETLTRTVDGGHGHVGTQEDTTLHFGLGDTEEATVTVYWPDLEGTTESFTLSADSVYVVRQGESPVEWTP